MHAHSRPRDPKFIAATIQVFTLHQELRKTRFRRREAIESPEFALLSVYWQCGINDNEQGAWFRSISATWNYVIGAADQDSQRSFPGSATKRNRNIITGNFACARMHDLANQLAQQRSIFLSRLQHALRVDFQ